MIILVLWILWLAILDNAIVLLCLVNIIVVILLFIC